MVALGKKIVLIEGKSSSLDKQTYNHILKNRFPDLVLLPSGGKGNLQAFEEIRRQVLDRTIWGVDFYMLADKDATPSISAGLETQIDSTSRFKSLSKYHLENYFLDANTLASCFSQMEEAGSWLRDPLKIDEELKNIAKRHIGYAASLIASKQVRDQAGNTDVMVKGANTLSKQQLIDSMLLNSEHEKSRILSSLSESNISSHVGEVYDELDTLLNEDSDRWKSFIPGKPVLAEFCGKANIPQGRLKTLYIRQAQESDADPFSEIYDIFKSFTV